MSNRPQEGEASDSKRSTDFLEALLRESVDGIIITDASEKIAAVSDAFCGFFSQPKQDVVGADMLMWIERFDAVAVERWAELKRRVHLEGKCSGVEFSMTTEAGTRYFSVSASALEKVAEEETGPVIAFWHETSDHKRVEEALVFRVELETLVASISTLFINLGMDEIDACIDYALEKIGAFLGADRGYVFQSDDRLESADNTHEWCAKGIEPQIDQLQGVALCDELPWFAEHIVNRKITFIPQVSELPPEAKPERERFEKQRIRSLVVVPMTSRAKLVGFLGFDIIRKDVHWTEDSITLLGIVGETIANTLERKRADEALRASEKKYRTIFENIQDVYFEALPDGTLVEISPSVGFLSRYERDDLIGKSLSDLYANPKDGMRLMKQILDEGQVSDSELILLDKDGTGIPFSMKARLLYDENHKPWKICGALRDISERKQLEEQLRHSQKMEAVGELAGGIAHDFNNLLTGILGHANLIKLDAEPDSDIYEAAETIEQTTERAAKLTQQLLGFAQKGKHQTVPIDVHRTVREIVELISRAFDRSIRITLDLSAPDSTIMGDPGQIQQALMNLVVNARNAMPDGGELTFHSGVVDLDANDCKSRGELRPGRYVVIDVVDTGVGIPEDMHSRVFEPFFTTKKQGKGTGMGLAMVYGIVSNHGGSVQIKSSPGKGTTFTVLLPLEESRTAELVARSASKPLGGTERILLVDDEAVVRNVASQLLRRLGYQVETATNGAEAASYYEQHHNKIDLVIIDMIMPKMGGRECFEALKAVKPNVKAIIATGYSIDGAAQDMIDAGVQSLIQKPFQISILAARVREALDREQVE